MNIKKSFCTALFLSQLISPLSFGAEAFQTNPLLPPEFLEVQTSNGPMIFKNAGAEQQLSPLACIYLSQTFPGYTVAPNTGVITFGPYTSNCTGYHRFDMINVTPSGALMTVQLEKLSGSTWTAVATSVSVAYYGTPGTYRAISFNQGFASSTSYQVRMQIPQ